MPIEVQGHVESGFEGVRDAFAENFERHGDVGAAFAAYQDGKLAVDLWGGIADQDAGRPWAEDTTVMVFSTTKGATALCANMLAERGELDVDAPVAEYWPEFAAEGKEDIPVRWLLCHKAGLPFVDRHITRDEALAWDPVVEALAEQEPAWEPGTAHGYHAVTYGWLVGEVVRRVSGRSVGRFFREEVADPLGLAFWIGLPAEHLDRVAPLIGIELPDHPHVTEILEQFLGPDTLLGKALLAPSGAFMPSGALTDVSAWNEPEVLAGEVPAANGVCDARSLARMYAAVIGEVDGTRLLGDDQVKAASENQTEGPDKVLFFESKFGLGFMLSTAFTPYGGPAGFGHAGAGGSTGFADPHAGLAVGYVMNAMQANVVGDLRAVGPVRALYEAVGAQL